MTGFYPPAARPVNVAECDERGIETTMRRREFVLSLAAARSRRVKLGIRSYVYQAHPMAEAARLIREAGLAGVHLGLRFADGIFDMRRPDWDYARRARDVFSAAGLPIAGLDGYVNLVHPDLAERERNLESLKNLLARAKDFGTTVVATEAGTVVPGKWTPPTSAEAEAVFKPLISGLKEAVRAAEGAGTILAVEPSFATPMGTVETVQRMFEEIPSPNLKILWDGAHLIQPADIADTAAALRRAYRIFGSRVVIAHANDVMLAEGRTRSCSPGEGKLDYKTFVSLLDRTGGDLYLCLEHAKEPDVPRLKSYVGKYL